MLDLKTYFAEHRGVGVMATSSRAGVVNTAIYAKPHVMTENEVVFIMRDRLTRANLQENGHAGYLFLEDGSSFQGVRLLLTKTGEDTDGELIASLSRRHLSAEEDQARGEKFLVRFRVNKVLDLVGGEEKTAG